MNFTCSERLFAWQSDPQRPIPTDRHFVDAGFKLNLVENPQLILTVHYDHILDEPDYTGYDLVYQLEPPKREIRTLSLVSWDFVLPKNMENAVADVNCRVDSPVPLRLFRGGLHTHDLATAAAVYVYNEERDEFRTILRARPRNNNIPQFDELIYPGEYLAGRCTYNTMGQEEDIVLGREMCRLNFKVMVEGETDVRFENCHDTMKTELGEKLIRELPKESMIPLD